MHGGLVLWILAWGTDLAFWYSLCPIFFAPVVFPVSWLPFFFMLLMLLWSRSVALWFCIHYVIIIFNSCQVKLSETRNVEGLHFYFFHDYFNMFIVVVFLLYSFMFLLEDKTLLALYQLNMREWLKHTIWWTKSCSSLCWSMIVLRISFETWRYGNSLWKYILIFTVCPKSCVLGRIEKAWAWLYNRAEGNQWSWETGRCLHVLWVIKRKNMKCWLRLNPLMNIFVDAMTLL